MKLLRIRGTDIPPELWDQNGEGMPLKIETTASSPAGDPFEQIELEVADLGGGTEHTKEAFKV